MESGVRSQESGVRSQESGVRPVVSFCVPVYNNAEASVKVISNILVSDDPRLEVVACDNASTDNTQEALSQIRDPRLKYFRNEKNLGAHMNWCRALGHGSGDWLYLVMGRDKIHGENAGELIRLLKYAEDHNITCIRDGHSYRKSVDTYSGIKAMIRFLGGNHPTGAVFNRRLFQAIPDDVKLKYFTSSDMYPENFVWRDLIMQGTAALTMSGVFECAGLVETNHVVLNKSEIKSTVEKRGNILDTFFAPKGRMKLFRELISMVIVDLRDKFTEKEKTEYIISKFYALLNNVSYAWCVWCEDAEQMAHYGQNVRTITVREMWSNILKAYPEASAYLNEIGELTLIRKLRMRWCMLVMGVYAPIAAKSKKLLQALGIWHSLRRFLRKVFVR